MVWVRFDIGSLFIVIRLTLNGLWLTIIAFKVSYYRRKVDNMGENGDRCPR